MKNVAQTASSILVGAASIAYLVEHGPKIYYKALHRYYSRRVKTVQKMLKELKESAELRIDLEWSISGQTVAQKYIDEHAGDDRETDPELILHSLKHMYRSYGLGIIMGDMAKHYAALMQKSLPPRVREQIQQDVSTTEENMQELKEQLEDFGFDPDQLVQAFQPA